MKMTILKDYLPKGVINNYNVIINGKKFLWLNNYSDIKQYEEIRKLTTGQGEDCSTFRLSICQKSL